MVKGRKVANSNSKKPSTMPENPVEIPAEAGDPEFAKAQAEAMEGKPKEEEVSPVTKAINAVLTAAQILSGHDFATMSDDQQKTVVSLTMKPSPDAMPGTPKYKRTVLLSSLFLLARNFQRDYKEVEGHFNEVDHESSLAAQTALADQEAREGHEAVEPAEADAPSEGRPRRRSGSRRKDGNASD